MTIHRRQRGVLALLAILLTGCSASPSDQPGPTEPEASATPLATLVGTYSVEYHTTESDSEVITGDTVVRSAEVTGSSCTPSACDFIFTSEVKEPDGSTGTTSTELAFDGSVYRGPHVSTHSCDGFITLQTVEDGIEYSAETTITPATFDTVDGQSVVTSFEVVVVEHNEVTEAGRTAGCKAINLAGSDAYATNTTTVGIATRKP